MSRRARSTGEEFVVEHVWGDRLFSATPMYVVEDMRDAVRLWCPAGTRVQMAWTPQQRSRPDVTRLETLVDCLTNEDWVLIEEEVRTSSLWLMEAGRGYALAYFWLGGSPLGWYVNSRSLQRGSTPAFRRWIRPSTSSSTGTSTGLGKMRTSYRQLVDHGLVTPQKAEMIRRGGLEAIERLETRAPPFSESWEDWQPDPAWAVPVLPAGWTRARS
jgi:hypothetical protein